LPRYRVAEICAGAGGQSLGLELAGFEHELSVELDADACATLRHNRPHWKVAQGDVASPGVWNPAEYAGVDLLAGGVPCPPFTVAGRQLGATDERDLFAWAVELCGIVEPRALLLENVRGLSFPRFAAYRQRVLDRLAELGYAAGWRLLHASDYGVPQLRPRFVLVAMRPADFAYFSWPAPQGTPPTVGEALFDLMAANGWPGAAAWAARASDIAPTIVGGSKKHGGPDLGPTRAKRAWREMGVDALGLAAAAPADADPVSLLPRLTCAMVARIQGWDDGEYRWEFTGRKTASYRQVGNAFPPPVARALGSAIRRALDRESGPDGEDSPGGPGDRSAAVHDPVYGVLREHRGFLTVEQIRGRLATQLDAPGVQRHLAHLGRDFHIEVEARETGDAYRLGAFKAFVGQDDHLRHEAFLNPSKIS
jgi:DNA (cytosine-5)-methyltransferase 1